MSTTPRTRYANTLNALEHDLAAMTAERDELRQDSEQLRALERAALAWWRLGRPANWTQAQHAQTPEVNACSPATKRLARICAEIVKRRKDKAI